MSAAASVKIASVDSPIYEVLAERWSPYAFRDKPVSQDELRSLFEAARRRPTTNSPGAMLWQPGMTVRNSNGCCPALWRETRPGRSACWCLRWVP